MYNRANVRRHIWRDLAAALSLLAPLLCLFFPVTFGGRTLLPVENIYQWEPWRSFARAQGVPPPHNPLLSDLVLETLPWKRFLVEALRNGELPLWNPYTFGGAPFLAAGQHSALYPPAWLFLVMPAERAIGFYTLLNLCLGGLFLYTFLRVIGVSRFGAVAGGLTFELSGCMLASVVFPMIVGAAIWLPLMLALVELLLRPVERGEPGNRSHLRWALLGALCLGVQCLAGHPEFTYYVLLTTGIYALVRGWLVGRTLGYRPLLRPALALATAIALGLMLGAAQTAPMFELVTRSFRQDSGSYDEVVRYAYPPRQVATFLMPDFFGNPTHHSFYDVVDRVERALPPDPSGERRGYLWARGDRGKNYVESAAYVGILPLLLAAAALRLRRTPQTLALAAVAALALLFAFGTPLYALLYYLVPGWQQVHTPFRWVFPYTVAVAALAGIGACALDSHRRERAGRAARWLRHLNRAALGLAALLLAGLAVTLAWPALGLRLAGAVLRRAPALQEGFANPQLFYSYEVRNVAILAGMLLLSGGVLWLARGPRGLWRPLALGVIAFDLWLLFGGFNAASNPAPLAFTPPLVEFLQRDREPYRLAVYRGDKPLNANLPMLYGIGDSRGYDSIVTQQYVEFMGLIEHQGALAYNRISDLYERRSLDSPLLDLLGVRYLATPERIDDPRWRLVYDRELKLYRNERALPRAFLVFDAVVEPEHARSDDVMRRPGFDPGRLAVLDRAPAGGLPGLAGGEPAAASIRAYRLNDVVVETAAERPGVLVLTDSFFPGWGARVDGESAELLRAYGNFRAVYVPAGRHLIEFRYLPLSVLAGALTSALGLALVGLGALALGWRRLYREGADSVTVRRVAKNSAAPMLSSLYVKLIDVVFAFLVFRVLGPLGVGAYAFAVAINGYQETFNTWGLGTLTIREVARRPEEANRYLGQMLLLRLALWAAIAPLTALCLTIWQAAAGLDPAVGLAVALLTLAMIPSNISASVSAVFQARERMEVPAAVQVVTATLRVALGLGALLAGWGFVGLAAVALICNLITASMFVALMRGARLWPRFDLTPAQGRELLRAASPLMLNDFLQRAFFRFDVLLLELLAGSRILGFYAAAYKFIDGMIIVPSSFTYAIFPIISRFASAHRESGGPLERAYRLAIKYMLLISLPTAAGTTIIAEEIIRIVAGERFLPESALALQILIWFLPFSFVNGVTQYVLIAVDEQRSITRSFLIAAPFNVVVNLATIPLFGFVAASAMTVLSELVLMAPFLLALRRKLKLPAPLELVWRPALASAIMAGPTWWLHVQGTPIALIIPAAAAIYALALVALGALDETDRAILRQLRRGRS